MNELSVSLKVRTSEKSNIKHIVNILSFNSKTPNISISIDENTMNVKIVDCIEKIKESISLLEDVENYYGSLTKIGTFKTEEIPGFTYAEAYIINNKIFFVSEDLNFKAGLKEKTYYLTDLKSDTEIYSTYIDEEGSFSEDFYKGYFMKEYLYNLNIKIQRT